MASPVSRDAVDKRAVLLARVETAVQEINAAQEALGTLGLEQPLVRRVRGRLDGVFDRTREQMLTLARAVRAAQPDGADAALSKRWREYTRLDAELRPVHQECLAFIEGILVRGQRLDRGICEVADGLLYELKRRCGISWDRFTILAEGELFGELADVIRLRFPALDVWELPVAAHELGHLAAPTLATDSGDTPFMTLLQTQRAPIDVPPGASYDDYLHEHFADVFATYTMGVSYAAVSLLLRFDAAGAHVDREEHPAARKRGHVILRTLARLDPESAISRPFSAVAGRLGGHWTAALATAGVEPELPHAQRERLDELEAELAGILDETLDADGRYRAQWWRRAEDIADALARTEQTAPQPAANELIADVLNGAWLYRLTPFDRDMESLRSAARRARERCAAIARRPHDDEGS
jgi:hypothetical protein